jgi:hypothetical protein
MTMADRRRFAALMMPRTSTEEEAWFAEGTGTRMRGLIGMLVSVALGPAGLPTCLRRSRSDSGDVLSSLS